MGILRDANKRGSSPRMRGTLFVPLFCFLVNGIIPAYAGNTPPWQTSIAWCRDHPRVCGEHECEELLQIMIAGSSPRMRGTLHIQQTTGRGVGIIPAYAGNTNWLPPAGMTLEDHPRVCGEHNVRLHWCPPFWGSSPRMRGTLPADEASAVVTGIIPAYAGNTPVGMVISTLTRDHPRVCGEHQV